MKNEMTLEQKSEREVVITRTFDAPARIVFEAWTKPEHMKRWWVPKSMGMTLLSCEMDVRTGGGYRFVFKHPAVEGETMAFFGKYVEVSPHSRLVWTNDESGGDGQLSTLTLEEHDGKTRIVLREVYPTAAAYEAGKGAYDGMPESFAQLDELLLG